MRKRTARHFSASPAGRAALHIKRASAWVEDSNGFGSVFSEQCVANCTSQYPCEQGDNACICTITNLVSISDCILAESACQQSDSDEFFSEAGEWCASVYGSEWATDQAAITGSVAASSYSQSAVGSSASVLQDANSTAASASYTTTLSGASSSWYTATASQQAQEISQSSTSNTTPSDTSALESGTLSKASGSSSEALSTSSSASLANTTADAATALTGQSSVGLASSSDISAEAVSAATSLPAFDASTDGGPSVGVSVGVALGVVCLCGLIIGLFCFCIRRKKYNRAGGQLLIPGASYASSGSETSSFGHMKREKIDSMGRAPATRMFSVGPTFYQTEKPPGVASSERNALPSSGLGTPAPVTSPGLRASIYPGSSYQGPPTGTETTFPVTPSVRSYTTSRGKRKSVVPSIFTGAFPSSGQSALGSPTEAAPTRRGSMDLAWASLARENDTNHHPPPTPATPIASA